MSLSPPQLHLHPPQPHHQPTPEPPKSPLPDTNESPSASASATLTPKSHLLNNLHLKIASPKYTLSNPPWYRNSLLASTGYLEFANAGDFAANVWNEIPVPRHAMILMAIGGPLALMMSVVAVRDGVLSWRNVRVLRAEREYLRSLRESYLGEDEAVRVIDGRLGVGFRELGTELIDRIAMDVFLGIGALLVGVGTLMAIWGAHPRVFEISNLLSGFVGNAFAAAFGVVNALWSGYLVLRFRRHATCVDIPGSGTEVFRERLLLRFGRFQWHAVISGVTGLVAGAASMVTARMWWGYVVLIPCMVLQVGCNRFWRGRLGYDRHLVSDVVDGEKDGEGVEALLDALTTTIGLYNGDGVGVDWGDLGSLVEFVCGNDLFDSLCDWIAGDEAVPGEIRERVLSAAVEDGGGEGEVRVLPEHVLQLGEEGVDVLGEFLRTRGRRVLLCRERFLLELVGYIFTYT